MAFPITLKPLRGQIFKVTSEPGETIRDLKGKVAEHGSEFPEALQQLIYRGKILKDTDVVLDLGIKPDQFIVVMLIKTKPKQKLVANASATVQTPINCPTVPAVVPTATESEAVTVAAPSVAPPVATPVVPPVAPPVAPPTPPPVAPPVAPMVAPPDLQVARRVQPFPSTDVIIANATIETVAEPPVSLLADLRLSPQFAAMARMLLQEPQQALRYMLPRLVRGNLDLARAIQDNLPAFLQLLQEVGSRPRLSDGNWDELLASNPELLEEMLPEIEAQDFEMAEAIRSDPAAFLAAFQRPR
mmetsp:Transcript_61590/g.121880  ORF Transcript_61590/g.121880 Transcript_61590/m.121880 type:complete len:301 (+) Transcript_61590:86-988(+)